MSELWRDTLMTGDQCAICEGPVGDDGLTLEDETGALVRVCQVCAVRLAPAAASEATESANAVPTDVAADAVPVSPDSPPTPAAPSFETPAQALTALRAIRERRAEEHGALAAIARLLERQANDLMDWQTRASTYEQHGRSLEAELKRTRERLQRAEELLASCTPEEGGLPIPAELTHPVAPRSQVELPEAPLGLEDVRVAQRYFNESPHVEKLASVRRSLGRPSVNLVRLAGAIPRLLVTAAWEIIWYQYLIDLGAEVAAEDRVTLYAEGMELEELLPHYKQVNANLDDNGRLDASELEVSLLSGESELLTEMSPDEERALEDATEEIWDRHAMPEFRWDD